MIHCRIQFARDIVSAGLATINNSQGVRRIQYIVAAYILGAAVFWIIVSIERISRHIGIRRHIRGIEYRRVLICKAGLCVVYYWSLLTGADNLTPYIAGVNIYAATAGTTTKYIQRPKVFLWHMTIEVNRHRHWFIQCRW